MPIYHKLGEVPPKRHIAFRSPDGGVYQEELVGNHGFVGPSSRLYHLRPPTTVKACERLVDASYRAEGDRPLRLRHFRTAGLPVGGSPVTDRIPLLFNGDVALLMALPDRDDDRFYRNGQADEIVVVVEGAGTLESQYGLLPYEAGDQVVIPRGILHRYRMKAVTHRLFVVESRGYVRIPRRYVGRHGGMLEGAPFCERDLKIPEELVTHDETGEFELVVKQTGAFHRVVLDHHPCDLVGWDGHYFPWAFNIRDFEPIVGMIHQPPPVHQVFEGDGFVVCDFCPRPFDFHPEAVPAPYNHANVMSDEVLLYLSKEFMSRKGIEHGSITLHPDGLTHGPHPGRYEGSIGAERTDEVAFMIDTFKPLEVAVPALSIEDPDYVTSWLES